MNADPADLLSNDALADARLLATLTVRDAQDDDLPRIVEIYNDSIAGGWSTADTEPVTVESRRDWFARRDPNRRPVWIAEAEDDSGRRVAVAWVALTSFYGGRPAYDATAEISTYVANRWHRRGIGTYLKRRMIAACPRLGVTTLLSMYFDHNPATERINAALGFEPAGVLPEIANVRGEKRGLVVALRRISANASSDG